MKISCYKVKIGHIDGAIDKIKFRLCLYFSAVDKVSAIALLENACGSLILQIDCTLLWFQTSGRLDVPRAKSWSWLRHSNPCVPKSHSSVICLRTQSRKTHQSSVSGADLLTCMPKTPCINTKTFIESLTNWRWILMAWLIMREQLGLCCGFWNKYSCDFFDFSICRLNTCWSVWPGLSNLGEDQWVSCPPKVSVSSPSSFCHLFQLLICTTTFLLLLAV